MLDTGPAAMSTVRWLLYDVECTWYYYRTAKVKLVNRSFGNLVVETSTLHIAQQPFDK